MSSDNPIYLGEAVYAFFDGSFGSMTTAVSASSTWSRKCFATSTNGTRNRSHNPLQDKGITPRKAKYGLPVP